MATRMHGASVFIFTIWSNAVTPSWMPQNQSEGQEITEKDHGNNPIHVKKRLCKRYPPKMLVTGKLTEENVMIPKNPKRCEMKKWEVPPASVPLTVLVKELDPPEEVACGRTTTET